MDNLLTAPHQDPMAWLRTSAPAGAHLHLAGRFFLWSTRGYVTEAFLDPQATYDVLTPKSIVAVLAAGFEPDIHESILALL